MTHVNLDDLIERLLQRAEAEQNVANRLYEAKASKESYQKAHVTAGVLRELAATFEQMSQEHPSINDIEEAADKQEAALGLIWDLIDYVDSIVDGNGGHAFDFGKLARLNDKVKDLLKGNPPPEISEERKAMSERMGMLRQKVREMQIAQTNGGGSPGMASLIGDMKKILKM